MFQEPVILYVTLDVRMATDATGSQRQVGWGRMPPPGRTHTQTDNPET